MPTSPAYSPDQPARSEVDGLIRLSAPTSFGDSFLVDLLDDAKVGTIAATGLSKTLLVFDSFHDVKAKADKAWPEATRGR